MEDLKKCSKCGCFKNRSEFFKNKNTKDNCNKHCKECRKIYYDLNKKNIKEYKKIYHDLNKEKINENTKKHTINLSNFYVIDLLVGKTDLIKEQIPQSLIEAKREQIKLIRLIKELSN